MSDVRKSLAIDVGASASFDAGVVSASASFSNAFSMKRHELKKNEQVEMSVE